mmetsp:Transcript_41823/g.69857  ORF Transcript_41823/g.69857 Transcript_41823/m.69857 type:complete len:202 (+) Transcript_41823:433-1038(+)
MLRRPVDLAVRVILARVVPPEEDRVALVELYLKGVGLVAGPNVVHTKHAFPVGVHFHPRERRRSTLLRRVKHDNNGGDAVAAALKEALALRVDVALRRARVAAIQMAVVRLSLVVPQHVYALLALHAQPEPLGGLLLKNAGTLLGAGHPRSHAGAVVAHLALVVLGPDDGGAHEVGQRAGGEVVALRRGEEPANHARPRGV